MLCNRSLSLSYYKAMCSLRLCVLKVVVGIGSNFESLRLQSRINEFVSHLAMSWLAPCSRPAAAGKRQIERQKWEAAKGHQLHPQIQWQATLTHRTLASLHEERPGNERPLISISQHPTQRQRPLHEDRRRRKLKISKTARMDTQAHILSISGHLHGSVK